MRIILVLAAETDFFVTTLRQPLTCAGFDFLVEPSLDSLVYEVACDSQAAACQLTHRGIEVNRITHALVVNRLSPYQNASISPFQQSEVAAGIWAVLSSLSVPVLNRPSDVGIFPGSDPSYLAPRLRSLGWRFSRLFGASIGDLRSDNALLLHEQTQQTLDNCFAFLLAGESVIPIWGGNDNSTIRDRLPELLKTFAEAGITFAFVAVAIENERPSILELNPWPTADFIKAYATPVAKAIAKNYP